MANPNIGKFGGTPPDLEQLNQFITEASQGWLDDRGMIYRGIRRVAVGVRSENRLIASIAVGLPGISWDDGTMERVVQCLKEKAEQVEVFLRNKKEVTRGGRYNESE